MSKSFIVFDSRLPWIYPLVSELGKFGSALAVDFNVRFPFSKKTFEWPYGDNSSLIERQVWSYPPGFNSKLSFFFRHLIKHRIKKNINRLEKKTGSQPYVIVSNPNFYKYVEGIESNKLVYLIYDDYSIDSNGNTKTEMPEEDALIKRAGTILCSSKYQVKQFLKRFPDRQSDIYHFPHGAHSFFINPEPAKMENPKTVCSVGRLTARYDWELIYAIDKNLIDVEFLFVGDISMGMNNGQIENWHKLLYKVLDMPNVKHIDKIKHFDSFLYYWNSAVNWMPYKVDLKFVKASCPLKLMDGLASGRPVICSSVPEARLYPRWVNIYKDRNEAIKLLQTAVENSEKPEMLKHKLQQTEFALLNNWESRAVQLNKILEGQSGMN